MTSEAPDHPFVPPEPTIELMCWHAVTTLDSGHVVRCGLPLRDHVSLPTGPSIQPTELKDGA